MVIGAKNMKMPMALNTKNRQDRGDFLTFCSLLVFMIPLRIVPGCAF
jgi:hypothetical protein